MNTTNEIPEKKNTENEEIQNKSTDKQEENEYKDLENKDEKSSVLTSQHKLNSPWAFWYTSRKEKDHLIPYEDRIRKVVSFDTLEDFFKYYMFIKPASEIERNTDMAMFKEGFKPLWEACTDGGCWFLRFKKNEDPYELDLKWEKLLFTLIGIIY